MKRILAHSLSILLIALLLLLPITACSPNTPSRSEGSPAGTLSTNAGGQVLLNRYDGAFTGTFDTVVSLIAFAPDKPAFDRWMKQTEERFHELDRLFDIYTEYQETPNLWTINAQAGIAPVRVDGEIIRLIQYCLRQDALSPGTVNIALGPVLAIWHDHREAALSGGKAVLPDQQVLAAAAKLSDPARIQINEAASTVFLPEKGMRLDVGAVAKGYATELVAQELQKSGLTSGLLSAGGSNVKVIGRPADGRAPEGQAEWSIGLQDPDADPLDIKASPLDIVRTHDQSVVTSGDYQRFYTVDGITYAHLIDSKTLHPARYFRAVTIVTPDSALADYLSTAVFLLPLQQGSELVERIPNCEAIWILPDKSVVMTDGLRSMLASTHATSAK